MAPNCRIIYSAPAVFHDVSEMNIEVVVYLAESCKLQAFAVAVWGRHVSGVNCCPNLCLCTSIRRDLLSSVYQSLVVALVLLRRDYGNATLAGLLACLLNHLQSVLNATARSIAALRRLKHIADAVVSFHWLRALEHIKFKLAVTVYRALHGTTP